MDLPGQLRFDYSAVDTIHTEGALPLPAVAEWYQPPGWQSDNEIVDLAVARMRRERGFE
jgi:hypothetical protein